jgi:hypothetical protein
VRGSSRFFFLEEEESLDKRIVLCAKEIDLLVTNKGRAGHYTKVQGQQRT